MTVYIFTAVTHIVLGSCVRMLSLARTRRMKGYHTRIAVASRTARTHSSRADVMKNQTQEVLLSHVRHFKLHSQILVLHHQGYATCVLSRGFRPAL